MKKWLLAGMLFSATTLQGQPALRWTADKAQRWYRHQGWLLGCNYLPATAINQLEMWQGPSFDSAQIEKELGWAEGLGFSTLRVFLHDLAWQSDPVGFKSRMNIFLGLAARHHIKPLFVFFDDCWNPDPKPGPQPAPRKGIHNSGWVRSPARAIHDDSLRWAGLEAYVKDILTRFGSDSRILLWDLYNEPGNSGYDLASLPLLEKIFQWARAAGPSQPLTCGIWYDQPRLNAFSLGHSDIITFHNYGDSAALAAQIHQLQALGRPVICTEYMARTRGSRFATHLPLMKGLGVGALNWGFVSGKSNTIYQWDTPVPDGSEPPVWFHDIFRADGTPFDPAEIRLIKSLTGRN